MTSETKPTENDLAYLKANPHKAEKFDAQFGVGASAAALDHSSEQKPSQNDVDYLLANPDKADKFDGHFGEGASASYLQPAPAEAPISMGDHEDFVGPMPVDGPNPAPEGDQPGILKSLAQGALHGVQEAGNETVDALEAADIAMSKKLDEWGIPSRLTITDKEGNLDVGLKFFNESDGDSDWLGGETTTKGDAVEATVIKEPVSSLGRFTSSTTQFIAGFLGAKKITGLTGLVGAMVNGAVADGIAFDPDDPNLSAWAESNEHAIPILTEALATDPEDPEWLNRMRNVTEGVIIGGAIDLTIKGLRGLATVAKGRKVGGEAGAALEKEGMTLVDEAAAEAQEAMEQGVPLEAKALETPKTDIPEVPEEALSSASTKEPASLVNEDALRASLKDEELVDIEQIANSEWFNASKMDGPVEAQRMIEVAGDALAHSGALEKLGLDQPETFVTIIKDAKEELASLTGGSIDELTSRVAAVGDSAVDQAKFLVAGKMALQSTGREVSKAVKQLDAMYAVGNVDRTLEAQLLNLMDTHSNLQAHLKRVQTSAARAVSAGRITTTDGLDSAAVDALTRVEAAGGSKAVKDAVKRLRLAEGPTQQAALLRQMRRGSVANRAMKVTNEVFINSILSGWGTHAVNMTSNMINVMVLPMERAIGGALTGSRGELRAGLEQYAALRSSVMDGLRLSSRVLKTEMPVLDTQVKLDYQQEGLKAVSAEALGVNNRIGGALVNGIGQAVRVPGRFLMAEDEFFKQIMFRSRLKSKLTVDAAAMSKTELERLGYDSKGAFVEGETEAATLGIQALEDQWDGLVLKGRVVDDPATKAAFIKDNIGAANEGGSRYAKDALRTAREATFTTPLQEGTLSHGYQQMANRHPFLRQITPFIQTPVNILNKAFDRAPGVNLLRTRYRERLRSADPSIKAEAAGEMATGVALSTALYMLALEGRITGGGPVDSKQRQIWMQDKNWQPYSLNVGSAEAPQWIELKRLDPYAFTFGVAGDISEMVQAAQDDPSLDQAGMFAMLAASVGNNLTSKTWLQGMSDVVEVLASKDRPWVVQHWLEGKAAALVPYSSAGRTYNQGQDGYMKEARGYLDKMKANIPGMSSDLATRYNWVDGEAIETPTKLLGYIRTREGDGDLVTQELRRLNYGFTGPDRKIGAITLSSEQFQEWNKLMGSVTIGGTNLKQRLKAAMGHPQYDLEREKIPDGLTSPSESHRVDMLRGVMTSYKQKSRSVLFETYPELYEAWREFEEYEAKARSGQVEEGGRENLLLKF